jgi:hypothetical protein
MGSSETLQPRFAAGAAACFIEGTLEMTVINVMVQWQAGVSRRSGPLMLFCIW